MWTLVCSWESTAGDEVEEEVVAGSALEQEGLVVTRMVVPLRSSPASAVDPASGPPTQGSGLWAPRITTATKGSSESNEPNLTNGTSGTNYGP